MKKGLWHASRCSTTQSFLIHIIQMASCHCWVGGSWMRDTDSNLLRRHRAVIRNLIFLQTAPLQLDTIGPLINTSHHHWLIRNHTPLQASSKSTTSAKHQVQGLFWILSLSLLTAPQTSAWESLFDFLSHRPCCFLMLENFSLTTLSASTTSLFVPPLTPFGSSQSGENVVMVSLGNT